MRAHVIEAGRIANTIEVESLSVLPGLVSAQGNEGIGWLYDGHVFTAPPAPPPVVPFSVSRRQGRQALLLAGKLSLVQPAIDAVADVTQRGLAQIYWDDSQEFERNHATLIALATQIGLTSADLDSLFITAKALP